MCIRRGVRCRYAAEICTRSNNAEHCGGSRFWHWATSGRREGRLENGEVLVVSTNYVQGFGFLCIVVWVKTIIGQLVDMDIHLILISLPIRDHDVSCLVMVYGRSCCHRCHFFVFGQLFVVGVRFSCADWPPVPLSRNTARRRCSPVVVLAGWRINQPAKIWTNDSQRQRFSLLKHNSPHGATACVPRCCRCCLHETSPPCTFVSHCIWVFVCMPEYCSPSKGSFNQVAS